MFGGSKQDCRSAHRASKVTSILEEGMPATDLSAQSDISEIGILVAVSKFAPKARQLLLFLRQHTRGHVTKDFGAQSKTWHANFNSLKLREYFCLKMRLPRGRAPKRQFFPQKFCVKSKSTPVFLSKKSEFGA